MKLFHVVVFTLAIAGAFAGGRTEDEDIKKEWKKECKKKIKNKEDSDRWNAKMDKCMAKQQSKADKQAAKDQKRADRVTMKAAVRDLKEEKAAVKAERNLCKARCGQLANQVTKQNCLDYWNTATRAKIEEILGDILDLKSQGNGAQRSDDDSHCLTEAGLTGEETTCKDAAVAYCDTLDIIKPSQEIRTCKTTCMDQCMNGEDCNVEVKPKSGR